MANGDLVPVAAHASFTLDAEAVAGSDDPLPADVIFQEADHQRTRGGIRFMSEADLALAEGLERRHVDLAFDIVRAKKEEIVAAASALRARCLQSLGGCGQAPP